MSSPLILPYGQIDLWKDYMSLTSFLCHLYFTLNSAAKIPRSALGACTTTIFTQKHLL